MFGFSLGALAAVWCWIVADDPRLQWEATLATGFAAIFVAWLTVRAIDRQIQEAREQENDRRRRRARAAKAALPMALSAVDEYSKASIVGLYKIRPYFFERGGAPDRAHILKPLSGWPTPELPESVMQVLKECIEFCDDQPAATMAELIRRFQVQHLRLSLDLSSLRANDPSRPVLRTHVDEGILSAAELFALAEVLFPFSRDERPDVPDFGHREIERGLSFAGCMTTSEIASLGERWQRERLAALTLPGRTMSPK